jgi:hypothetical protein
MYSPKKTLKLFVSAKRKMVSVGSGCPGGPMKGMDPSHRCSLARQRLDDHRIHLEFFLHPPQNGQPNSAPGHDCMTLQYWMKLPFKRATVAAGACQNAKTAINVIKASRTCLPKRFRMRTMRSRLGRGILSLHNPAVRASV